jgi:chromosomal replication initiator protein
MDHHRENIRDNIQIMPLSDGAELSVQTCRLQELQKAAETESRLNRSFRNPTVEERDGGESKRPSSGQMTLPGVESASLSPMANARFTFDQFVVGPCNEFAYQAAWAVAEGKRHAYNPLYLYGGSGLGKSHLSGAIGNQIHVNEPSTRIVYTTAEEFVNEMVSAIRKSEMGEFKRKYRRCCDILFVDGVHFFSGKEKTQSELSHTFDHLYNLEKRIILTGAVPPYGLSHVNDGLKSRLAGGLVVDIQPPDFETRKRIFHQKAAYDGVAIPEKVVDLLASRIFGSVRRLEGLLINMIAKSSLMSRPIDLELAQEVIGSLQAMENSKLTIPTIQKFMAQQYHLEIEQLVSPSRRKSICYPRQLAMYLCRRFTDESLDTIGRAFCRDHASVIHSIGVINRQLREKGTVRREVDFLIEKLRPWRKEGV